ncbi:uncharacterized protein NFIA_100050 [Aspergillus fischeri NRRL 181]|uniref:Uncharacterized protein n=1 Tax=Neosartorya fischeri (strain ATCC 1020 / DSM 3700 / CBS 544.65 / FGSC A1164 / JCM 1740 / NRRL 181 / WB 181) TaxID=331117 RepID=A1DBX8_NEOFI|nr:uncharacterized protein NFIA_100050 [Aspergillus fischeri NRRL 181]EAW20368.1 hypothetical protein NFIA_100050 [Aspergillus fischeri NRRL 181]KAG2007957.1 hypothetical protein GB937_008150 [Aspergillus fischeri]
MIADATDNVQALNAAENAGFFTRTEHDISTRRLRRFIARELLLPAGRPPSSAAFWTKKGRVDWESVRVQHWSLALESVMNGVCNVGALLMFLSEDRFKRTFYHVKAPSENDHWLFWRLVQPCIFLPAVIQSPLKTYPTVTGERFTSNGMRNFAAVG